MSVVTVSISLNKRAAASLAEHSSQETEEKWWKDSQAETREKSTRTGESERAVQPPDRDQILIPQLGRVNRAMFLDALRSPSASSSV